MLEAQDLYDVALRAAIEWEPQTEASLRRSISTAYYAVFHSLLRRVADHLIDAAISRHEWVRIYRGIDHARLAKVLLALNVPGVSQSLRDLSSVFGSLKEGRHRADYDPMAIHSIMDAVDQLQNAELALKAVPNVPGGEIAVIIVRLMFGVQKNG